ncbi:sugar ABC transporter substrate-binding protein [Cognatishimia sp. WU-CL00825]|uniref:ABC transporter substrate-binding protein n=1 Tax=Cognatishimia sp. WU-CL00825 TaxID=3127658 RepID=UPI0031057DE3
MKLNLTTAACAALVTYATAATAADVKLRYAIWDQSQAPTLQKIIDAYEAHNPDIDVELQVTPWGKYWTKLQTEAGNGNLPDVFWMNPFNFPLYASNGVVLPIDDLAEKSGFDVEVIPPVMRNIYSYEGELFSLPNNRDAIVVWYNKSIFEAAGVAEPVAGWTWADFQDMAAALTDSDNGVWGTAAYLNFRQVWINTIHQAGGSILSEDEQTALWNTEAAAAGVKYWAEIAQAGSSPTVEQLSDTDQYSMFLSGKLGMIYAGSWLGVGFAESELAAKGDIGVAVLPKGPINGAASTSSLGNMIGASTKYVDQAYDFVEFMGSKEAAAIYTSGGIALSAYPEFDKNFTAYYADKFDATPISDQIGDVFGLPRSFNSPEWLKLQNPEIAPIFKGRVSVEEGLADLQKAMQAALDRE